MNTIEENRNLAHKNARRFLGAGFEPKDTLPMTLGSLDWRPYVIGSYNQRELAELNIALNPHGCLGRIAIALATAEIAFPEEAKSIKFGEVVEDFFWHEMMHQWNYKYRFVASSGGSLPEGWIRELLMYEEPHGVLVIDGVQYDPLFSLSNSPQNAKHPKVHSLDPWSAIHCATMVAHASLEPDLRKRLTRLEAAAAACPTMLLPIQNAAEVYFRLDMIGEAGSCIRDVLKWRKTVDGFVMWNLLTGEEHPDRRFLYDEFLWPLVAEEFANMLAGMMEDEVCA